ncbi:RND family efflux transporter, MFP subunit [Shimia gijangensis]|uniref:RND family efflux transporter, MFP subunit n=1 Tax=Shimia gijangensis TaxID=1470563 RepID=A0A1M6FCJ3_9RHOB|nr:HlyD family efflux transporter periplasmic adaptor subunit [Shimia gijangensis]SHI95458.1 RND family efflux transporter, MFP subunit [Shimia gijangensis]
MRFLRQSLTGLFLLGLTIALMLVAGQMIYGAVSERMARDSAAPEGRERVFAVGVQIVEPQSIAPELVAFGEVRSRRSLEVRAKSSGSIITLSSDFVDGGEVALGETLLQIDPTTAEFSLSRAKNDLLDAEAEQRDADRNLELAKAELEATEAQTALRLKALARQSDLLEREVGTTAAVEAAELAVAAANQTVVTRRQFVAQSEARVDQAVTRLDRARIALAEAERALAETKIHAGFTGTLSEVTVVKGRLVAINEKLATLIDANALEVAFRVSTPQYVRLLDENGRLPAAEVTVLLDVMGQDLSATGVVSRESAVVGEGETGRRIYARLDAPRGLKPGDFVTVRLREAEIMNVVKLPSAALDSQNRVMVVGGNDRLEAVQVTLLRRQGDHIILEATGLAGKQVVTRLTPLLGPGIRVKPLVSGSVEAIAPTAPAMVALDDDARARFIAAIESNTTMPAERKARVLDLLAQPEVPAGLIERLKSRSGG